MTNKIEKAWADLYQSTAEPRLSLPKQICLASLAGLCAGVLAGLLFFLK